MKSIYELDKNDVDKYINAKGIKHCPHCGSQNTIEPVYDDDLKVIYRTVNFLKYSDLTRQLEHEMDSFEVMITCSYCGVINSIAPLDIASLLDVN